MASKFDEELLKDARDENRKNGSAFKLGGEGNGSENPGGSETSKSSQTSQTQTGENSGNGSQGEPLKNAKDKDGENKTGDNSDPGTGAEPVPPGGSNEFREKFDEYFKGAGSIIAGSAITEIADDFKTKLLFIYAKKSGVDIPMEVLKMDTKSKEFCSFLIDYAIKNKLFGFIEKYPLVAAGGVVVISGLSSFLFVEMMKKGNEEKKKAEAENAELREKLKKYENVQDAEIVDKEGGDSVADMIKKL